MQKKNFVIRNRYLDSVKLMSIAAIVRKLDGVEDVSVMMGTEANRDLINAAGLLDEDGSKADSNDIIIAVKAISSEAIEKVFEEVKNHLQTRATADPDDKLNPKTLEEALTINQDLNMAFFSIPGSYVKFEAMKALEKGLNLMIFSDNVKIEEEAAIKKRAAELGLLVMGPDCGTAVINGVALGFANVLERGKIGIVGASGTGIQEVSVLLSNRGYGISHAIGLGGRDLKPEIGGIMMKQGIKALTADANTELIILISKPPAPEVAREVLDLAKSCDKKIVVNFLKGDASEAEKRGLPFANSLESAAELAIAVFENQKYIPKEFDVSEEIQRLIAKIKPKISGKYLRGLYSGGTLADETLLILSQSGIDCFSNIPLKKELSLQNNWVSEKNTIVDLGEDEFTKGRPHPMIDFTLRNDRLIKEAGDKEVSVILIDLVEGYGSNADPASAILPAIEQIRHKRGESIAIIASVCGTEKDPQPRSSQIELLKKAGVIIMPSNAQAARFAGRIIS